jgi:hypothetical protein
MISFDEIVRDDAKRLVLLHKTDSLEFNGFKKIWPLGLAQNRCPV